MKKLSILVGVLLLVSVGAVQAATIDTHLTQEIAENGPDAWVNVYVVLKYQVDLEALQSEMDARQANRLQRHYEVITRCQEIAAETQPQLLAELNAAEGDAMVRDIRPFWISNSIALTIKPAFLDTLKNHPDIASVYFDPPLELIEPVDVKADSREGKGVENGITDSRAPELWAMGVDGAGALACDQDTGADGNHAAFADRWRGLDPGVDPSHAWFDPVYNQTFPTDSGSHGTHTLGTILGDDGAGNQVGMAPGAKWIGAKTIDVPGGNIYSDAVAAFEWMADPDGNPATIDDVPDACNNSWGIPYSHCESDFWAAIDTAEAAGVIVVFAAGNEGPGAETLRSPGDRAATDYNVFSVCALNQDGATAADFSARGPSACDHTSFKPEVSAIGVDVRSSIPGGSYSTMSGTSMATPHVVGAVCLLRSAFPEATVEQVKAALYLTAVDLGATGEDNTFGMGKIDLVEAYFWLLAHMVNSDGKIFISQSRDYSCDDVLIINVMDEDLTGATVNITVASTTEPAGETLTLDLTDTAGVYEGTIATDGGAPAADGQIQVVDSDTITATYLDEDNGMGGTNIEKTDEAGTDCLAPLFGGLTGATPGDYEVTLTWNPANDVNPIVYNIFRSEDSGVYNFNEPHATATESPYVDEGAQNNTTYYYIVRAADVIGNEETNLVELSATPFGPNRLLSEDWEDDDSLADWEIIDAGCSATWKLESGGYYPFSGNYIFVESYDCVFGWMDDTLVSPLINTKHYNELELRYDHEFDMGFLPTSEKAIVEFSLDGGDNWTQLLRYYDSAEGEEVLTLPDECESVRNFRLRFIFKANVLFGSSWGLDNIEVVGWPDGTGDDDDDDDDSCCG